MPSIEHEAPVELFRQHPEVVPTLLQRLLHVELPYYSAVRVTDPGARIVVPSGKRSDASVVLWDGRRPVVSVILEPQGSVDPSKHRSWPKYTADQFAELGCDTYLLVLALTRAVARWARQPIASFQPGKGFCPYVIGPDELPRLSSLPAACEEPWLSALTAMLHAGDDEGPDEALLALRAAKETAGPKQAFWLYELLRAIMAPDRYRRLEEFVMLSPESYLPKTDWEHMQYGKGMSAGKAESILRVLVRRGIDVSGEQQARIMAERDGATLDQWIDRSVTVQSCAELFV